MSNFSDFFPAAGGGGGIPKYQEFITSGTFTPTQALIDAGGRVSLFIVAGGGGGSDSTSDNTGGAGGEVLMQYVTLANTNAITVTIGAGGAILLPGADSTFAASTAGGVDIVALGGEAGRNNFIQTVAPAGRLTAGFPSLGKWAYLASSAGSGVFGYGAGGSSYRGGAGIYQAKPNSGCGAGYSQPGGSGFVRVTWFE
tara:strand:+ start:36 stop:629 length:594 start_codon:yes stop_codon:yes gene_type:complete